MFAFGNGFAECVTPERQLKSRFETERVSETRDALGETKLYGSCSEREGRGRWEEVAG